MSIILIISMLLIVILLGCGNNAQKKLIGQWSVEENDNVWEFFKDGTWQVGEEIGEYIIVDDGRLKMTHSIDSRPIIADYSINNKTLTLTFDGNSIVLQKK